MKPVEKQRARDLRSAGWSIKAIAREVGVSQGSVSVWTRDIELSAEQLAALEDRAAAGRWSARREWSERNRARRQAAQDRGRVRAREGDPLYVAGCMLYWGEGAKDRNVVQLGNSDLALLRLFIEFLERCFAADRSRLRLAIHCHLTNGLSQEEIERWWLERLDLTRASLTRTQVDVISKYSKRRRNILLHGTARVSLHSTEVVQEIFGAIQELGGFERPEWLG